MELFQIAPHWQNLVEDKSKNYSDIQGDFSSFSIIVHNATWCPDCERETVELLALCRALGEKAPSLEIVHYEDIEEYKKAKAQKTLPISCLPTIIFLKDENELGKIEEESDPNFRELALRFMAK